MTTTPQPAPLEMVVEVLKFYGEDEALSLLTAYMASAASKDVGAVRPMSFTVHGDKPLSAEGEEALKAMLTLARSELNASEASAASPAVPEGYWLAPNEPTEEMAKAGLEKLQCQLRDRSSGSGFLWSSDPVDIYRAMRAAAPVPAPSMMEALKLALRDHDGE